MLFSLTWEEKESWGQGLKILEGLQVDYLYQQSEIKLVDVGDPINIQSTLQTTMQAVPHDSPTQQPLDCGEAIQLYQPLVIMNSGKSLTQMGLFEQCQSYDQLKYGLLQIINKTSHVPIGITMGLCLPKVCEAEEIQDISQFAFHNMSLPIIGKYIQSPQVFDPTYGPAFYITVTLLSIFGLALLVSTVFSKLAKKSQVLGAFSLRKSLHTFEYKQHKFNVFNGIKSLCMMWVILGHMYSVRLQNVVNVLTIKDQVEGPFFLLVLSAFYAVDVFFYIGGFLVAYSFLRNSMKSMLKYPLAIVHRLLRFWPSYIMAMMIYYGIMIHTGSGPLWYKLETAGQIDYCSEMWKPIIFVDNIVDNGERMCMGWGWYLQNDMQIFIISIPILYLYFKNRKASYISIQVLILLSLIYNFIEVQVNEYITIAHRPDFAKWNSYFPNVYIKPWTRCPPYLYGLTLGLLYMEFVEEEKNKGVEGIGFFSIIKRKLHNSRMLKNGIQLLGLAIIIFIVVIPRTLQVGHTWPQAVHSTYLTFSKLFFVIGVSMLVTPTLVGIKNDLFYFLMDTKLFNFVAKISFWTYLIHYMIIEHSCYIQKLDFYYDTQDVLTLYFPVALIAMGFGLVGTLLIEIPFAKLEKMLFETKKDKKKAEPENATKQGGQVLVNESVATGQSIASTESAGSRLSLQGP